MLTRLVPPAAASRILRRLTRQEAQLRELCERVKLQDELLDATVNALVTLRELSPNDARHVAARLRDLMFDRRNLIDRASWL